MLKLYVLAAGNSTGRYRSPNNNYSLGSASGVPSKTRPTRVRITFTNIIMKIIDWLSLFQFTDTSLYSNLQVGRRKANDKTCVHHMSVKSKRLKFFECLLTYTDNGCSLLFSKLYPLLMCFKIKRNSFLDNELL